MALTGAPLFQTQIKDHTVRFFAGKLGFRELPWVSLDDLFALLGLPADMRDLILWVVGKVRDPSQVDALVTSQGSTTIVSHAVAYGLLAHSSVPGTRPEIVERYLEAAHCAMTWILFDAEVSLV
jgi:hypothetical protein